MGDEREERGQGTGREKMEEGAVNPFARRANERFMCPFVVRM